MQQTQYVKQNVRVIDIDMIGSEAFMVEERHAGWTLADVDSRFPRNVTPPKIYMSHNTDNLQLRTTFYMANNRLTDGKCRGM